MILIDYTISLPIKVNIEDDIYNEFVEYIKKHAKNSSMNNYEPYDFLECFSGKILEDRILKRYPDGSTIEIFNCEITDDEYNKVSKVIQEAQSNPCCLYNKNRNFKFCPECGTKYL